MKQNFAGQPDGGGALGYAGPLPTLTGKDLMSDVSKSSIFRPEPLFVDNCKTKKCMKNASGMKNFDDDNNYDYEKGGSFSLGNWNLFDVISTAGGLYSESMRNKSAEEQARLALQIQQQRAAQAKAEADAKKAEAGSIAGKIKAYTVPLIVVGVLTIGGIGAYFYFKKKKIS
jgi:hypothetical protein